MSFITITAGSKKPLSLNFTENEFYSNSIDAPRSHPVSRELVDAAQFLRSHFGVSWRITSTFRTRRHEQAICNAYGLAAGLVDTSQHRTGRAMDSQPVSNTSVIMVTLHADFLSQGPIFQQLRTLGVVGFGIYDTFIHLDTRTTGGKQHDQLGTFAFWDNRTNSTKKATPNRTKSTPKTAAPVSVDSLPQPLLRTSHGS